MCSRSIGKISFLPSEVVKEEKLLSFHLCYCETFYFVHYLFTCCMLYRNWCLIYFVCLLNLCAHNLVIVGANGASTYVVMSTMILSVCCCTATCLRHFYTCLIKRLMHWTCVFCAHAVGLCLNFSCSTESLGNEFKWWRWPPQARKTPKKKGARVQSKSHGNS